MVHSPRSQPAMLAVQACTVTFWCCVGRKLPRTEQRFTAVVRQLLGSVFFSVQICDIWTEFSWRALAGALRDTAQQQMELKSLHAELYQRKSMVCQLSHMCCAHASVLAGRCEITELPRFSGCAFSWLSR